MLTVSQLAERLGADLVGDDSVEIDVVGPLGTAEGSTVTFISDDRYLSDLQDCQAGAIIISKKAEGFNGAQLIVKNVTAALIEVLKIFAPKLKKSVAGIDPLAKVGENISLGKDVSIGPFVAIDDNVEIGDGSVIASGCRVGENTKIGSDTRLDSNVVVYHNCVIGNNVIIQANCVIGSTGFGYSFIEGAHRLIPHNGKVVIEDFVELGPGCCIDRAKYGQTKIGAGTKFDNLVHIAHNVIIGRCCLIAGQVGIAGSSKLGDGVVLAGQAGITDNVEVGDGVMVGGGSAVLGNIEAGKRIWGFPAFESRDALKATAVFRRLPELSKQFKNIVKRVDKLEATEDNRL